MIVLESHNPYKVIMPLVFMGDKLVDVIRDGEIVTVSEAQARAEDLFILRERHAPPAAPAPLTGHPALRTTIPVRATSAQKAVPRWHSYQPEYTKNNVAKELIDNFHWEIGKARRERNMTRLQMANALNTNEGIIKMLENGELPSDDFVLINKVQSFCILIYDAMARVLTLLRGRSFLLLYLRQVLVLLLLLWQSRTMTRIFP